MQLKVIQPSGSTHCSGIQYFLPTLQVKKTGKSGNMTVLDFLVCALGCKISAMRILKPGSTSINMPNAKNVGTKLRQRHHHRRQTSSKHPFAAILTFFPKVGILRMVKVRKRI